MKSYLISFTLLLALAACQDKKPVEKFTITDVKLTPPSANKAYDKRAEKAVSGNDIYANSPAKPQPVDTAKKIIKDGEIRFQAGDLKLTKGKVVEALFKLGGYVADESETNNGDSNQREFNLKVRIPSKNFDKFLETLSGNAERIDAKNIHIRDVTTEYIDVTTQIKNKKLLESRYQGLMAKATKMADLLEIEDKLTEIRTDIESTQGQLNYMTSQIAYSTLDITFYSKQNGQVNNQNEFGYKFKIALAEGWGILLTIVYTIIALWPVLIIAAIVLWVSKRWMKKKKVKTDAAN
jgi:hypothetical protein